MEVIVPKSIPGIRQALVEHMMDNANKFSGMSDKFDDV